MATRQPAKPTPSARYQEIATHTDAFCAQLLNEEYRDMCRLMAKNFCVKASPALEGDARKWAAAIVNAVGYVNFLTDKTFPPYYTVQDLAKRLGYSYSTLKKYTDVLIEGFELTRFDLDFTLPSLMKMNPLLALINSPSVLLGECSGETPDEAHECCQDDSCCQLAPKPPVKRKKHPRN